MFPPIKKLTAAERALTDSLRGDRLQTLVHEPGNPVTLGRKEKRQGVSARVAPAGSLEAAPGWATAPAAANPSRAGVSPPARTLNVGVLQSSELSLPSPDGLFTPFLVRDLLQPTHFKSRFYTDDSGVCFGAQPSSLLGDTQLPTCHFIPSSSRVALTKTQRLILWLPINRTTIHADATAHGLEVVFDSSLLSLTPTNPSINPEASASEACIPFTNSHYFHC